MADTPERQGLQAQFSIAGAILYPISAFKIALKNSFCNWIPYLCTNATPPKGRCIFFLL